MRHVHSLILAAGLLMASPALAGEYHPGGDTTEVNHSFNSKTEHTDVSLSKNETETKTITKDSNNKLDVEVTKEDNDTKTIDSYNKTDKTETKTIDSNNKSEKTITKDSNNKTDKTEIKDSYNKTDKTDTRTIDSYNKSEKTIDSYNDNSKTFKLTFIAPVSKVDLDAAVCGNSAGSAALGLAAASQTTKLDVQNSMNGATGITVGAMNAGANVIQQNAVNVSSVVNN